MATRADDLIDRRRMRRKLTFWRVAALLIAVVALVAASVWTVRGDLAGTGTAHIAKVRIEGTITEDDELLDRLETIRKSAAVKGVILSVDSPGGTTAGGEAIFEAVRKLAADKPVVAQVGTLAASAGYMIAIGGDQIVAGETSITGSIGVIFQYPQVKGLLDKLGVSLEEIKSAPLKAEPSPFHAPPEGAKVAMQAMVDDSFAWFVDIVAERRKLPRPEVLTLADGRIFTGRQAAKLKLIDKVGGIKEIRDYFATKNVGADLPVVDWKPKPEGSNFFLGALALDLADSMGLGWLKNAATLKNMSEDKLLLDGLVSVWQFEGN